MSETAGDESKATPPKVEVEGKSVEEILEQIDLFAGLPTIHLKRVADIGVEVSYKRGSKMFEEGDAGDKFYVILDGSIRISRTVPGMGEEALAVLRAGNYFGEMSLIDESPRSATALAHEACQLFEVGRQDLEELLFVDRDLAYEFLWNVVRTLSRRLRATNDKMTFLATTSKF
jgi:CRP/FNR family transcriptional regulator, cyclic AMP receptor protein